MFPRLRDDSRTPKEITAEPKRVAAPIDSRTTEGQSRITKFAKAMLDIRRSTLTRRFSRVAFFPRVINSTGSRALSALYFRWNAKWRDADGGGHEGYLSSHPRERKKSLGWGKCSRRWRVVPQRGTQRKPARQPAGEPRSVSFQFPAASSPMGFSAHRLTHPQPRVFDDIPIYSQLLAGTLYAELLFFQSIRLC